ncbi:chromosome partitioning protein ParB [Capnocytophaga gingivalis]|uniref:chromosome partitioning protein ParB n=1 Tax=Capnocytophaga gingivalis TaxID=1017 RepID=UPI0023F43230|nr:chromosome partitioning protein ParB [Capnocytophaga gingivalis]
MSKEYEAFVEKFKPKKTTDDCYTPPNVYEEVLNYVRETCDIERLEVIRPFYPGGDYERVTYTEKTVVVDNPPFSIISQIIRFYNEKGVKYFLFAPHLTIFGTNQKYTAIVASADITYENGAKVKTSFVTNMMGDYKIIGAPDLKKRIEVRQKKDRVRVSLPKYKYPENVVTVSRIASLVEKGVGIKIKEKDLAFCRGLESQKKYKKGIFGSGYLTTHAVAAEIKAAEIKAAEIKAAEIKAAVEVIEWELSEHEKEIIDALTK